MKSLAAGGRRITGSAGCLQSLTITLMSMNSNQTGPKTIYSQMFSLHQEKGPLYHHVVATSPTFFPFSAELRLTEKWRRLCTAALQQLHVASVS